MEIVEVSGVELEAACEERGIVLPIEQTRVWAALESTIEGRSKWGSLAFVRDGEPCAYLTLFDYRTHGYHYLRAVHGPVWVAEPSAQDEQELADALVAYVRKRDRKQVFVRMAFAAELECTRPTLSTVPYDQTVVIDISGGGDQEQILSRMKPRGRRDVRKALRESPATCADETAQASKSFDEYYAVMVETAARDGFAPAPQSSYENMIRILGPEHCRVFCARVDGVVASWSIVTVMGTHAVRYYGASASNVRGRMRITDALVLFEATTLSAEGKLTYDMMGIGDDFAPSLMGLNEFKCKFTKETTPVAPDRDLPLRKVVYGSLVKAKSLMRRGRDKADADAKDKGKDAPSAKDKGKDAPAAKDAASKGGVA